MLGLKKNNKEITSTLLVIQRFLLRIGFIFLRNDLLTPDVQLYCNLSFVSNNYC